MSSILRRVWWGYLRSTLMSTAEHSQIPLDSGPLQIRQDPDLVTESRTRRVLFVPSDLCPIVVTWDPGVVPTTTVYVEEPCLIFYGKGETPT